jgi:rhodanese-related sulfurtransferase
MGALIGIPNFHLQERRPEFAQPALREGEITLRQARALPDPLWVDARSVEDYNRGHLPGALLLNHDNWNEALPQFLRAWRPGRPVIVYCSSAACEDSHTIAGRLRAGDVTPVHVLHGGWETLRKEAP